MTRPESPRLPGRALGSAPYSAKTPLAPSRLLANPEGDPVRSNPEPLTGAVQRCDLALEHLTKLVPPSARRALGPGRRDLFGPSWGFRRDAETTLEVPGSFGRWAVLMGCAFTAGLADDLEGFAPVLGVVVGRMEGLDERLNIFGRGGSESWAACDTL